MKQIRKIIFWCHLLAGLTAGSVILIMSITGALLAFERQIVDFAERDLKTVPSPTGEAHRLGAGALLAKVSNARSDAKPTSVTIQANPTASIAVALERDEMVYLNPYSGEILGNGAKRLRGFFHWVTDLHRWLGTGNENRAIGRGITGACNIAFLMLAITGLYIWWPKSWSRSQLTAVTVYKFRLKGRARDFNWHNVTGIWSVLMLILITSTGTVMSYQWANNLLYTLTGSEPPAPPAASERGSTQNREPRGEHNKEAKNRDKDTQGRDKETQDQTRDHNREHNREAQSSDQSAKPPVTAADAGSNLDQLWLRAEQQSPSWQSISLRLPLRANAPITFAIDEGKAWNPLARSQLTLDANTAAIVKWEPYAGLSLGRRLRTWVRVTHTGEGFGLPGQMVVFLASLGTVLLIFTGFALAWRRCRVWMAKRAGAASASSATSA